MTPEEIEKKRLKAEYDKAYRIKNRAKIKARKAAYFQKTYDPIKAAIDRKKRMPKHIEYCRQPKYKAWKKEYDRIYRAKKHYGEFWEAAIILNEIQQNVDNREAKKMNKIYNKSKKRKRAYEVKCNKSQRSSMGNP